jgi:hypothetical protein
MCRHAVKVEQLIGAEEQYPPQRRIQTVERPPKRGLHGPRERSLHLERAVGEFGRERGIAGGKFGELQLNVEVE